MPSLDVILNDTLIMIGATDNPTDLKTFQPGIGQLAERPTPQLNGPDNQAIWYWRYSGAPMNRVEALEVWSRTVAEQHHKPNMQDPPDLGWMTVAMLVEFGKIKVHFPFDEFELPLTAKYFVKGLMLPRGSNKGLNSLWPLQADLDKSFASIFAYDLTMRPGRGKPPEAVLPQDLARLDFMPWPNVQSGAEAGSLGNLNDRHFVCVVLSLVCMRERPDFDPQGAIGMGRFYPHLMIMSNKRLTGRKWIEAAISIRRPDQSGYHGGLIPEPRIMSHPDMDPKIVPLLATETNIDRGWIAAQGGPYWDLIFDYFLPLDYSRGTTEPIRQGTETQVVDRRHFGSTPVVDVLEHLDYRKPGQILRRRPSLRSLLGRGRPMPTAADFLSVKKLIQKLPRQGTFDNVHFAPRMMAHMLVRFPGWIKAGQDTLTKIIMAPICEHDCMHTHWRWGAIFKSILPDNDLPLRGFAFNPLDHFNGTGQPHRIVGNTMVPLNQDVYVSFDGNQQFHYRVEITDVAPGVWQPVFHHGSGYALGFSWIGAPLHAGARLLVADSSEDSELYWNLRYQATVDGPLERVRIDPAGLNKAMQARNTVRLHLKVFEEPPVISIERMLANAKAIFASQGIELLEASRETFTASDSEFARFQILLIGSDTPTDDQMDLFNLRGDAEPGDIVVYFVSALVPNQAGSAVHPPGRPGAVVSSLLATEWTLAHQIGHVLALDHVEGDGSGRLMTRHSTRSITERLPALDNTEIARILESDFVRV